MTSTSTVDAATRADVARRIGAAWRELRRGASMGALRTHLLGEGPDALDLGQIDGLELLAQQGDCRMSDLAEVLRVDASTATRAVDRLERAGLARRERCGRDGRVVRVVLTERGRQRHEELARRRAAAMEGILADLDDDERIVLAGLLERLVDGLDRFVDVGRSPST